MQLPQQSNKQSITPLQIFFPTKNIPLNLLLYLTWSVQSKWSIKTIAYELDVVFTFLQPGDVAYTKGKHKCSTLSLCWIEIRTINSKFNACLPFRIYSLVLNFIPLHFAGFLLQYTKINTAMTWSFHVTVIVFGVIQHTFTPLHFLTTKTL